MDKSRYNSFSDYLKKRYGTAVHKVSINAGFSCPNIDGTISSQGCIFCNNAAFSNYTTDQSLEKQIETGIDSARKRYKAEKFILYFQSYTNTYGPLEELKSKYEIIRKYPDFVALCIGTRPDCIDEPRASLLTEYLSICDVWVELGLQTSNDHILKAINRGHTFRQFVKAVELLHSRKIEIFAHVILGLPEETKSEMIETAKAVSRLPITGIKIHPLHIIKGTVLMKKYQDGNYNPMTRDEYIDYLIAFLEHTRKDIVILRLTADVRRNLLIKPEWINDKTELLKAIDEALKNKGTFQGAKT